MNGCATNQALSERIDQGLPIVWSPQGWGDAPSCGRWSKVAAVAHKMPPVHAGMGFDLHLFADLLPRHLELIYEINRRFLQQVRLRFPGNDVILRKLSIIDEEGSKAVRMAHLATIGAHHVNGVAALHSDLVRTQLLPEFAALWPEKFTNVTNGVTPRRWMALANPELSTLLDERVGNNWISNMENLKRLEAFQHDNAFLEQWGNTKLTVKRKLANYIHRHTNVLVDPASLFDVQVKRIHEYKRQHLNALQIVTQYLRIKNGWRLITICWRTRSLSAHRCASSRQWSLRWLWRPLLQLNLRWFLWVSRCGVCGARAEAWMMPLLMRT